MGRPGEKPVPPLNLIGDFGGGGMLLAFGMVCGLIAAGALFKVPESGIFRKKTPLKLWEELKWSLATRGRKWFMAMMVGLESLSSLITFSQ